MSLSLIDCSGLSPRIGARPIERPGAYVVPPITMAWLRRCLIESTLAHRLVGLSLEYESELVAAEPHDHAAWRRCRDEAIGDHAEKLISRGMAMAVVDRLELVQVEQADRRGHAIPAALLDLLHEVEPVRQTGECIPVRKLLKLALALQISRDVLQRQDHPVDRRHTDRIDTLDLNPERAPIAAEERAAREGGQRTGFERLQREQIAGELRPLLWRCQVDEARAAQLLAQEPAGSAGCTNNAPFPVDDQLGRHAEIEQRQRDVRREQCVVHRQIVSVVARSGGLLRHGCSRLSISLILLDHQSRASASWLVEYLDWVGSVP